MATNSAAINTAVVNFIHYMEGASNNAYAAVFAGYNSGLSFGYMQNDVGSNTAAQAIFSQVLIASGITGTEYSKIMTAAK